MKISFLVSSPDHPVNDQLKKYISSRMCDHELVVCRKPEELTVGDALFLISCNEIVDRGVLNKFHKCFVLHASDLPAGKGWSPHIWQILEGKEEITVCLLDADDELDCGDVYKRIKVDVPVDALWDQINQILFSAEIDLIDYAIENFPYLQKQPQPTNLPTSYYRKRTPQDSEIDPNISISAQFDLMRVCDPNRFPAWFNHRGQIYKIILEKL